MPEELKCPLCQKPILDIMDHRCGAVVEFRPNRVLEEFRKRIEAEKEDKDA